LQGGTPPNTRRSDLQKENKRQTIPGWEARKGRTQGEVGKGFGRAGLVQKMRLVGRERKESRRHTQRLCGNHFFKERQEGLGGSRTSGKKKTGNRGKTNASARNKIFRGEPLLRAEVGLKHQKLPGEGKGVSGRKSAVGRRGLTVHNCPTVFRTAYFVRETDQARGRKTGIGGKKTLPFSRHARSGGLPAGLEEAERGERKGMPPSRSTWNVFFYTSGL